jgi:hypothetical protein
MLWYTIATMMYCIINPAPTPDMGWAPILMIMGLMGLAILAPLSILIEACVFHWQMPGTRSFWKSLRNSLLVNLASGTLGFVWVFGQLPRLEELSERTGGDYYQASDIAQQAFWASVAVYWILSVIVEGVILMALDQKQHTRRRVWQVSLAANVLSYVALFGALLMQFN